MIGGAVRYWVLLVGLCAGAAVHAQAPGGEDTADSQDTASPQAQSAAHLVIPPYYQAVSPSTTTRAVLPLVYYRKVTGPRAATDLGVVPFYWSHVSAGTNNKVVFPFYWRLRSKHVRTDIVLQTYWRRGPNKWAFGMAPLVFAGQNREARTSYVAIPPVYWDFRRPGGGFRLALLYYDYRDGTDYQRGVVPFYFAGNKRNKRVATLVPPLLWRTTDNLNMVDTWVAGPLFLRLRAQGWSAGALPLLYFAHAPTWGRAMVLPFFVHLRSGATRGTYVLPLLSFLRKDAQGHQLQLALFYHRYRRAGAYVDMFSPLLWRWGNSRVFDTNWMLFPLFYRGTSPVHTRTMAGLLYWNFREHHVSHTVALLPVFARHKTPTAQRWWVAPTFDFGKDRKGWHAFLHPLVYVGKNTERSYFALPPLVWRFRTETDRSAVVAPLYWQFYSVQYQRLRRVIFPLWWQFEDFRRDKKTQVAFPFYWNVWNGQRRQRVVLTIPPLFWKVARPAESYTGVLNVSLHRARAKGRSYWTFNVFPLVLFGTPREADGVRWAVLHGLVGWKRAGAERTLRLFWIPIHWTK